uniref:Uncharacterized protein n=1 Tax=Cacopsylla melanoneura TaxID=428564 RepID=A0A8D8Q4E3_9HEMI
MLFSYPIFFNMFIRFRPVAITFISVTYRPITTISFLIIVIMFCSCWSFNTRMSIIRRTCGMCICVGFGFGAMRQIGVGFEAMRSIGVGFVNGQGRTFVLTLRLSCLLTSLCRVFTTSFWYASVLKDFIFISMFLILMMKLGFFAFMLFFNMFLYFSFQMIIFTYFCIFPSRIVIFQIRFTFFCLLSSRIVIFQIKITFFCLFPSRILIFLTG